MISNENLAKKFSAKVSMLPEEAFVDREEEVQRILSEIKKRREHHQPDKLQKIQDLANKIHEFNENYESEEKSSALLNLRKPKNPAPWPDPKALDLGRVDFNAVWDCIKTWDINVPEVDGEDMYSGATGNHVMSILLALGLRKPKDYYTKEEQDKLSKPELNAQEALFGFIAWLTGREESVTAGAHHGAAVWVELLKEFCEINNISNMRADWLDRIKYPKNK